MDENLRKRYRYQIDEIARKENIPLGVSSRARFLVDYILVDMRIVFSIEETDRNTIRFVYESSKSLEEQHNISLEIYDESTIILNFYNRIPPEASFNEKYIKIYEIFNDEKFPVLRMILSLINYDIEQ